MKRLEAKYAALHVVSNMDKLGNRKVRIVLRQLSIETIVL